MNRAFLLAITLVASAAFAQDRLPTMPRYDRYAKLRGEISGSVQRNDVTPNWSDDGKAMYFRKDGKNWRLDLASKKVSEGEPPARQGGGGQTRNRRNPERGRQFDTAFNADGTWKAVTRDRNVFIAKADGTSEYAVTSEGSAEKRTKYGVASWVYGEELGVREAMWWSPDGKTLAYYGFDETPVKDYFLAMDVTKVQNTLDVEAYPKAGADNPIVALWLFDVASQRKTKVDTAFGDATVGHYVYEVRWSPDGKWLLYNRTNRKQNVMEFCAANPATGQSRVVVREANPNAWTDNSPNIRWLTDSQTFLWESERNGFRNYYLGNLDGRALKPVTQHAFEVGSIVKLDEAKRQLWYMARSADNPYRHQLHRIGLDGRGDRRLTDPAFHHTVNVSADGKFFTDVAETIDTPPISRLCAGEDGKIIASLTQSDTKKWSELGLKKVERFKFKAADRTTDCYGYLQFPSDFDPTKRYPLIVDVYGGPESGGGSDRFMTPSATTEMGFLVAWIDGRGTSGRGKAHKDALYGKLGIVEIDDQAAGVKFLAQRPYVDGGRVGINGTSYGGYSSAMAILRYPDVFHAAVASSSVTKWENYDTIYTERYMGLPWEGENKAGYEAASAMGYAKQLKGRLMLFYGTADNNVHPANTYQLVQALQRSGKSFDLMVGPDQGHAGINAARELEYFVDALILSQAQSR